MILKVLALETSERIGTLAALIEEGDEITIAKTVTLPSGHRAAQTLVPAIHSLLADVQWKIGDLSLIAVTTGPGSFTGIRLGVTTAKTLSYATGAKLVGVHTLATIAAGVTAEYERLWTVLDAQRGQLFVSHFDAKSDPGAAQKTATDIIDAQEWIGNLRAGETVAGPPLAKLKDQLPSGVVLADEQVWKPRAEFVGRLAIEAYRAGATVDPMQLVPNYYRKSAAEEKAELQS